MLHFVKLHPHGNGSLQKQERRVAQSHSARAVHRKHRQLQTIQYQSKKSYARSKEVVAQDLQTSPTTALRLNGSLSPARKDPFNSFVRRFSEREHFLLDHCKLKVFSSVSVTRQSCSNSSVDVTIVVPLTRCHESGTYWSDRMTRIWVPLALTEHGLLDAVFLAACRDICGSWESHPQQQQHYLQLACWYKLSCIKSLKESICTEVVFSDATVAKTLMLAFDEVSTRLSNDSKVSS